MEEAAFAKLNLALHVRAREEDGYHRIETLFAFCEDGDVLAAEPAAGLTLDVTGSFAKGLGPDNLVLRAARALRDRLGIEAGAALTLDKRLPVASGIGGGSADAAAALRLLQRLWNAPLPDEKLHAIARSLGADVPACLASRACMGRGRGDELHPADTGLAGTPVLLVNPRVPLSTAAVFAAWDGVDRGPLSEDWRNDLEEPAIRLVPEIGEVLAALRAAPGTTLVRMSGSGATCFALFASEGSRDRAAEAIDPRWWRLPTRLR
jgi:4-diphosphocytidyl-2-C-methyl-D-erythritol kinase